MNDIGAIGAPPTTPAPGSPRAKLLETARQLESVFYGQLFRAMRATVPDGSMIQKGPGEQVFTGMLDDEIAKLATHQTDRGLAAAIYHELSRRLPPETAANPAAASTEPPHVATR